jgi:hypothetical protein
MTRGLDPQGRSNPGETNCVDKDARREAGHLVFYDRQPPALTGGADRLDFLVGRKRPGLFFRVSEPPVDGDVEHAGYSGHQLDLGPVTLQYGPRTEGARFIVSRLAPVDPDFHAILLGR